MKRVEVIGITGTHVGGTREQLSTLREFIIALGAKKLHAGDCIGVDAQAMLMARRFGVFVVSHPPADPKRRAFAPCDEMRDPLPYIVRDHNIVDETELLIGVPRHAHEELRSGTWATIRYAVKKQRTVYLILPDGKLMLYSGAIA